MSQHSTWYLLTDGTQADPDDCAPDDGGVLRHKDGLAVATHADGTPMSIGRAAHEGGNVAAAAAAGPAQDAPPAVVEPPRETREIKPEQPKRGAARTRESKAR